MKDRLVICSHCSAIVQHGSGIPIPGLCHDCEQLRQDELSLHEPPIQEPESSNPE